MVKLIEATKKNKKTGEDVAYNLYLVHLDSNNLGLVRGSEETYTIVGFFGDVRTAFKRALNFAVKGSDEAFTLQKVLDIVKELDEKIEKLDCGNLAKALEEKKERRKQLDKSS